MFVPDAVLVDKLDARNAAILRISHLAVAILVALLARAVSMF